MVLLIMDFSLYIPLKKKVNDDRIFILGWLSLYGNIVQFRYLVRCCSDYNNEETRERQMVRQSDSVTAGVSNRPFLKYN